jgi:hypothetical protein
MGDNDNDVENVFERAKNQTRHGAEAPSELSLSEAIQYHHASIEAGEETQQMSFRDERIAALLRGLEDTEQLEDLARDAESALEREGNTAEGRAATLRLLVRIGLQEVAPERIQTAVEARREYQAKYKNEF